MIWQLWLAPLVHAADYYLEGPYVSTRSDVVDMQESVAEAGHPGRVVRRFVDGQGWRFLVRVEGFSEQAEALSAADALVDRLGAAMDVLSSDGTSATLLARVEPGDDPGQVDPEPIPAVDPVAQQGAMRLLARAGVAHGVDRDTLTHWMEGPSLMAYRRTLADGTVVDHRWATREGAVFVEIEAVEGDAKSSRLLLKDGQAWLAVGDGDWAEQDYPRTEVLARDFGPAAVLPLVFVLRQAMESRREFALMQRAGRGEVDGAVHRRAGLRRGSGVVAPGGRDRRRGWPDPAGLLRGGRRGAPVRRLPRGGQPDVAPPRGEPAGRGDLGHRRGDPHSDRTGAGGRGLRDARGTIG